MPLGFSSSSKIYDTGVVFAGYGITSSQLRYDDYTASSVKGLVAVVFSGTPDGDNPHGQFARVGDIRFKAAAAQAAGARALMIIASEAKLNDDKLARLTYDNAGATAIPVVVVSRRLAQHLLSSAKLSDYEGVADSRSLVIKPDPKANPLDVGTETTIPQAALLRLPTGNKVSLVIDVVRR